MEREQLERIAKRWTAVPRGWWHACVGSGMNVMTGIFADPVIPDDAPDDEAWQPPPPVFICDVLPDYMVGDAAAWERRSAVIDFIINAPGDIRALMEERELLVDALQAIAGDFMDRARWFSANGDRLAHTGAPPVATGRGSAVVLKGIAFLTLERLGERRWREDGRDGAADGSTHAAGPEDARRAAMRAAGEID